MPFGTAHIRHGSCRGEERLAWKLPWRGEIGKDTTEERRNLGLVAATCAIIRSVSAMLHHVNVSVILMPQGIFNILHP